MKKKPLKKKNHQDQSPMDGLALPESVKPFLKAVDAANNSLRFRITLSSHGGLFGIVAQPPLDIGNASKIRYSGPIEELNYILTYLEDYTKVDLEKQVRIFNHYKEELRALPDYRVTLSKKEEPATQVKDTIKQDSPSAFMDYTAQGYEASLASLRQTQPADPHHTTYPQYFLELMRQHNMTFDSFAAIDTRFTEISVKLLSRQPQPDIEFFVKKWQSMPDPDRRLSPVEAAHLMVKAFPHTDKALALRGYWKHMPKPDMHRTQPEGETLPVHYHGYANRLQRKLDIIEKPDWQQTYSEYIEGLLYKKGLNTCSFVPEIESNELCKIMARPGASWVMKRFTDAWMNRAEVSERLTGDELQTLNEKTIAAVRVAKGYSEEPVKKQTHTEYMRNLLIDKDMKTTDFGPEFTKLFVSELMNGKSVGTEKVKKFTAYWQTLPGEKQLGDDEATMLTAKWEKSRDARLGHADKVLALRQADKAGAIRA